MAAKSTYIGWPSPLPAVRMRWEALHGNYLPELRSISTPPCSSSAMPCSVTAARKSEYPDADLPGGHPASNTNHPRPSRSSAKGPSASGFRRFEPRLFEFLEELADNNNRPWFQANKWRTMSKRSWSHAWPSSRHFQPRLRKILEVLCGQRSAGIGRFAAAGLSRHAHFPVAGSHTRPTPAFSFATNSARDIHAPGFYVHIAANECFLAVGSWRPDTEALSPDSASDRRVARPLAASPRRRRSSVNTLTWTAEA